MQNRTFHIAFICLLVLTLAILIYKWTNPARITSIDTLPQSPAQLVWTGYKT